MDPFAHASIGLLAKPYAPKATLLALLVATQVPDLLCFGFFAAGIEYGAVTELDLTQGLKYLSAPFIPWSHGFSMCVVWSILAAAIAFLFCRDRRVSVIIGLMVFSHWLLDFTVYLNIPVWFDNSQLTGLGLITSGPGLILGIVIEIGLIGGGIASYLTRGKRVTARMNG